MISPEYGFYLALVGLLALGIVFVLIGLWALCDVFLTKWRFWK